MPWFDVRTFKGLQSFSRWQTGLDGEIYVSEEGIDAEERNGGHPDWTIKAGSCCEFGVHFCNPSRMVVCSLLVITCTSCYSVNLRWPRWVWDFFIWREHDCESVCDIYFLCFSCRSRWELVLMPSSVEVLDLLPTFDLSSVMFWTITCPLVIAFATVLSIRGGKSMHCIKQCIKHYTVREECHLVYCKHSHKKTSNDI